MDGENNGKPYFLMDALGGNPLFLETPTFLRLLEVCFLWFHNPGCFFFNGGCIGFCQNDSKMKLESYNLIYIYIYLGTHIYMYKYIYTPITGCGPSLRMPLANDEGSVRDALLNM